MHIVIFGGGLQGLVIAGNLKARPEKPTVTIVDIVEPKNLPEGIKGVKADVLDQKQVNKVLEGASAAVLAVPSRIAHQALSNILKCKVPVVDVSFTPDPPLSLHKEAVAAGTPCIVDCGVAPGLSHILAAAAHRELGGLDSVKILVGGIPQKPPAAFHHAVYFNPCDLLAEYVRPARARSKGENIGPSPFEAAVEPFTDSEIPNIESFLSDGLRSLLTSFPDVPDMSERTIRWKGHFETMRNLHTMGFFEDETLPNTAASLNSKYPASAYPDYLLMVVEAEKGGKKMAWRMLDKHTDGISAMSRTTGFTTAAVAMLLARGHFKTPGVYPPEELGKDANLVKAVIDDLAERGVVARELTPAK